MEYLVNPFIAYISNWKKIFSIYVSVWNYNRPDSLGPAGWYQFLRQEYRAILVSCHVDTEFILYILAIGVAFTIIRWMCQRLLFDKIPNWLDMKEEYRDKFPECLFRLISYISIWLCSAYVILFSDYPVMDHPNNMWIEFVGPSTVVAPDVYFIYVLQCGYYVHCVYANIILDIHRSDFWALMLHHVVTLSLISLSYASRYHNAGVIVVFLHDICDVFLELAKISRYLQVLGGKHYWISDFVSWVAFLIFSSLWVVLRLYMFQTIVLMGTGVSSLLLDIDGEFYLLFNTLLLILYGLNVYWFGFILLVIYDIMVGVGISDKREEELLQKSKEEALKKKQQKDKES